MLGMFCSLWFTLVTLRNVKDRDEYERQELGLMIGVAFPSLFFLVCGFAIADSALRIQVLGYCSVVVNVIFFASPLSTVVTVVRSQNAASISAPLSLTILTCATFWFLYALGIPDYFILAPQACGITLSLLQLGLRFWYRATTTSTVAVEDATGDADGAEKPPAVVEVT